MSTRKLLTILVVFVGVIVGFGASFFKVPLLYYPLILFGSAVGVTIVQLIPMGKLSKDTQEMRAIHVNPPVVEKEPETSKNPPLLFHVYYATQYMGSLIVHTRYPWETIYDSISQPEVEYDQELQQILAEATDNMQITITKDAVTIPVAVTQSVCVCGYCLRRGQCAFHSVQTKSIKLDRSGLIPLTPYMWNIMRKKLGIINIEPYWMMSNYNELLIQKQRKTSGLSE